MTETLAPASAEGSLEFFRNEPNFSSKRKKLLAIPRRFE